MFWTAGETVFVTGRLKYSGTCRVKGWVAFNRGDLDYKRFNGKGLGVDLGKDATERVEIIYRKIIKYLIMDMLQLCLYQEEILIGRFDYTCNL